jgi:4-hydroxyphenylpyruvate dioxygenase
MTGMNHPATWGGAACETVLQRPGERLPRSIATVALSGTLEEKLAAVAHAGFDGVEIFENDLISCPLTPEEIQRRASSLGLAIYLYQPLRDFEAVSAGQLRANVRRAAAKFAVMRRLGTDTLLVCSNVGEDAIDDDALAAEQLARLADLAREQGIVIAYEALAWGRHVNRFEHSWEIVALADRPNLGIGLDSFHILSVDGELDLLRAIPGDRISFVQVADAPRMRMDLLQWSRHFRCFPGQGRLELVDFMARVLDTGYEGAISLEIFNDVFRQADPERIAIDGMRSLIALEERLATGRDAAPAGLPTPACSLAGYAFVEIAVDAAWERSLSGVLAAMGFRRQAVHRSKDVALWGEGGSVILVNTEPLPLRHRPWPLVSALALESGDPARSADRARSYLATAVPRHRGSGEAALTAVSAPDDTAVFFCRTERGGVDNWRNDFDVVDSPLADTSGARLGPIDHVALTQPLEHFDEASLFYESITGLHPQSSEELSTPQGLLRSRAMANDAQTVRLVLNAPLLGRGEASRPLPQHVAFCVADALAVARWTSANGLDILPVPRNYYEDLRARYELDVQLLADLQLSSVLYDRDGQGGEFLHFYTRAVGRGLFFEFVERRGGYTGYGAVNGPVRAAIQARLDASPTDPERHAVSTVRERESW